MGKKRRTREQKIIADLRRQLKQKEKVVYQSKESPSDKKPATPRKLNPPKSGTEPTEKLFFSYDPKLIKKDLVKTVILSFIFFGAIILVKLIFHL